jgi:hypothetical protein
VNGLNYIGKGIAIFGVWFGWGLAMRSVQIQNIQGSFEDLGDLGPFISICLYLIALALPIFTTLVALKRWSKRVEGDVKG